VQANFSQLVSEASNANKSVYEAFEQLSEANAQTWEKLAHAQLDLAGLMFEAGAAQLKLWGEARDSRAALSAQSVLVREYGNKLIQNARQNLAIIAGARDAYNAWIEQGVDTATENFRRTTARRAA
jgi:hypothetical protein